MNNFNEFINDLRNAWTGENRAQICNQAADLLKTQATTNQELLSKIEQLEAENKELADFVIAVGGFWGDSKSLLTGELSLAASINGASQELSKITNLYKVASKCLLEELKRAFEKDEEIEKLKAQVSMWVDRSWDLMADDKDPSPGITSFSEKISCAGGCGPLDGIVTVPVGATREENENS